jgi:hypothetical protein
MDDIDPMTVAIDQAAEYLRSALRAGRDAPVEPQALSARASDLISVLSRAQEVAMALSEQIETTARTHQLGSDDDTSANEHLARASGLLVQVAGESRRGGSGSGPGVERRGPPEAHRAARFGRGARALIRRSRPGEGHHHLAGAARENGRRAGGAGAGHACLA